jgi:hypothetical protein
VTKEWRNNIGVAFGAICAASFGSYLWRFHLYFSVRPTQPEPELGLVHRLNNHGSFVYVSDVESTGLALLMYAFLVGFAGALAIVPRTMVVPAPSTPRWVAYFPTFKNDVAQVSRTGYLVFVVSILVCLACIIFAGRSITEFAVSHGLVL